MNPIFTQAAVDQAWWAGLIAGCVWTLLLVAILFTLYQMSGWKIGVERISRWSQTEGK